MKATTISVCSSIYIISAQIVGADATPRIKREILAEDSNGLQETNYFITPISRQADTFHGIKLGQISIWKKGERMPSKIFK